MNLRVLQEHERGKACELCGSPAELWVAGGDGRDWFLGREWFVCLDCLVEHLREVMQERDL